MVMSGGGPQPVSRESHRTRNINKQTNKQTNKHTERAPIVELRLNGVHVWQQRVAFGLGFSAEVSVGEGFGVIRFGAQSSPQSH
jgi:hypothetical protein